MTSFDFHVDGDDQATIKVCTSQHVTLMFSSMVIDVFEEDGVIYTRQERMNDTEKAEFVEFYSGGTFDQINDNHAWMLELESRRAKLLDDINSILDDDYEEHLATGMHELDMFHVEIDTYGNDVGNYDEDFIETQLEYTQLDL